MNTMLNRLIEKRSDLQNVIDETIQHVADENRDAFDEAEDKNVRDAQTEIMSLDARIKDLAEIEQRAKAADDLNKQVRATGAREPRVRVVEEPAPKLTPGEYALNFLKMSRGDQEAGDILRRAVVNQGVNDNLGLIPQLIVGDLIKFVDDQRRITAAMRVLPMPQKGKVFERPRVTQRVLVSEQATEYDIVASQKLLITHDDVTKKVIGGAVNLSEADIDWSDPSVLDLVFQDLAGVYINEAETLAAAAIQAHAPSGATPNNIVTLSSSTTNAADFATAFATGAANIYGTAKALPDLTLAAVDQWERLAGLTDTTGRPLYVSLNPMNAPGAVNGFEGTGPLGTRVVVSPYFTSGFLALGVSRFLEHYEIDKGAAQIAAPSTLSMTLAYRGYVADLVQPQALVVFK